MGISISEYLPIACGLVCCILHSQHEEALSTNVTQGSCFSYIYMPTVLDNNQYAAQTGALTMQGTSQEASPVARRLWTECSQTSAARQASWHSGELPLHRQLQPDRSLSCRSKRLL